MFTSKIKIELELLGIPNIGKKYNKYINKNKYFQKSNHKDRG